MKGLKKKLSWLLIITMIFGQASFASLADSDDDDDYDTEVELINDLNGGTVRKSGARNYGFAPTFKTVKWDDTATPSVTTEEDDNNVAYYANGKEVTIIASGSNTYIVEKSGAHTEVNKNKKSFVYGGATASNAAQNTDITLQGGTVATIIGGNKCEGSLNNVKITINSGEVNVVYANASSRKVKSFGDIGGVETYERRHERTVDNAVITVNGGTVKTQLAGNAGYSYTGNLNITVNGGKIGRWDTDKYGLFVGGANGEVKTATVTVKNDSEISALSTGQRANVGTATYNLEGGKIDEIYAGAWYPSDMRFSNGSTWCNHYGKADTMVIDIGEGLEYGGLFAGFHMLDSERKAALEWFEKSNTYQFVKESYYPNNFNPSVKVSVAAAPKGVNGDTWLEGNDIIKNAFKATEYGKYAKVTLPKLIVKDGIITVADDAVATGSNTEMQILEGTKVEVKAEAPSSDQKFSKWDAVNLSLETEELESDPIEFNMPPGLADAKLTATYVDRGMTVNPDRLDLDLYSIKGLTTGNITIESDYATPSVASYDETVIRVDEDENDNKKYTVTALKEGSTTIEFSAVGTTKNILAEVPVTVKDTTPVLTVVDGKITEVGGEPCSETEMKIPEGAEVTLVEANQPDKIFTGWEGAEVAGNGIMTMPENSTTVTATYRDKVFQFADGTEKEVTLNVDQTDTNTQDIPLSYSFKLESDYDKYTVTNDDAAIAELTVVDGIWTVTAKAAGICKVLAKVTKDSGVVVELPITVTVTDTTKKIEAKSGEAEVEIKEDAIEKPDEVIKKAEESGVIPAGADVVEVAKKIEEVNSSVKSSIAANAAVKNAATVGFDNARNLEELGVPKGVAVVVYPKQELQKVDVAIVAKTKTVVDPVTGEKTEKTEYVPVVSKITYDITPFVKNADGNNSAAEKSLSGLRGSFTFRIPVPDGISETARYAKVDHENDKVPTYALIQTENGHKYVTVTTSHFSTFELEFVDTKPNNGGRGSGGGGGTRTTAATGKWMQNAIGWWYQNPDNTWPANAWLCLGGFANGTQWCHFDTAGYLQTGWFTDVDGQKYYLHPVGDGSRGYMYTGWHEIDGKWYYFTEARTETNPLGSLLVSTTTPDGHQVGADGARVQ